MPLDISTTISLNICHKRSALGWPIGVKMKISTKNVKSIKSKMYTIWLVYSFVSILTLNISQGV